MSLKAMTLKARIILVAMLGILLVSTTQIVTSMIVQGVTEERFSEATINGKNVLWRKIISHQLDQLQLVMTQVSRDRGSLEALVNGNAEELEDNIMSTYNRLSSSGTLTKMQISDTSGKIMYSSEDDFSEVTNIMLVHAALREKKIMRGMAIDDSGTLMAILAFPLFAQGRLAGAGIYLKEIEAALEDFKINDSSENFIFKSDGTSVYATDPDLLEQLNLELPDLGIEKQDVIKTGENIYSITIRPILNSVNKPLAHMVSINDMTESYLRQDRINIMSYLITLAMLAGSLIGIYLYMSNSFKPLKRAVESMDTIASGDLTTEIKVTSNDETGKLMGSMQSMQEKLHGILSMITGSTAHVASAAEQMSTITQNANDGIREQQAQTDQVAGAISQMKDTAHEVALNAAKAATSAHEADDGARDGRDVVTEVNNSISQLADEIEKAAQVIDKLDSESVNIGSVLEVIRSIAEQTNLLALNAAIEAARAGEQGRGFAVVADEVRTLASRTQESTSEIQDMIERLQSGAKEAVQVMQVGRSTVQTSVEYATRANDSLETITGAVSTISDMNNQIATAAEEQTSVVDSITRNIETITHIASKTSEGSEQTLKASDELAKLAIQLQEMVGQFKI